MLNFIIGFLTATVVFGIIHWIFFKVYKVDGIFIEGEKIPDEWIGKEEK